MADRTSEVDDAVSATSPDDDSGVEEVSGVAALSDTDRRVLALCLAFAAIPFLIGAISLLRERWYPVLDMAMTELRVRDVGSADTPLIGLPGRIGDFPDQGSHPGPISFWILAPLHRLTGGRAYGLQLGTLALNAALAVGIVAAFARAGRRHGEAGLAALGGLALVSFLTRGYGLDVLGHPWNPYLPLLWWTGLLVATWRLLDGEIRAIVFVVVAACVAAQTHVPYLPIVLAMVALAAAELVRRARRDGVGTVARPVAVALAVGVVLWIPPLIDQLTEEPGNVTMLVEHFATDQPGDSIGLVEAGELTLRHLDLPSAVMRVAAGSEGLIELSREPDGSPLGGLVTVGAWAVAVAVALRRRHSSLLRLHVVLGVAVVAGWIAMSRIFGAVWYYLTLWAWSTTALVGATLVWTAVLVARGRSAVAGRPERPDARSRSLVVAGAVAGVMTVGAVVASTGLRPPDPELSEGLGLVVDDTIDAVRAGVGPAPGPDATYVVFWQDSTFIGAQGYGMVNELERAGLDVGVHPTWRVPVTPQRVLDPAEIDAEVHVVTGVFVDEWRRRPDFVEVAAADPRTDDERAEYEGVRARVLDRLADPGCGDCDGLDELVDVNVFGLVVAARERRLDADLIEDVERMVELGQPISVFLAPPGNSF